jgi:hypothetical protein
LAASVLGLAAVALLVPGGLSQEPVAAPRPADRKAPVDLKKFHLELLMLKTAQKTLAAEREAAARQLDAPAPAEESSDTLKLRLRWAELMRHLEGPPGSPPPRIEGPVLPKQPDGAEGPTTQPLDALALAENLYRAGDFDAALKAFRQIDLTGMRAEERVPVQYLIATCLRKLGKAGEAEARYREVANSRLDPVMAECAQWQLATMRWQSDLRSQVETLKQRRKALESLP